MWRLHRYYLKELTVNAAITFTVLFGVVLVSLVYRGISRSQGGDLVDAALITLFFALDSLAHMVTISFLIATVLTFTRAVQDRELIAIRAAGISPRTPMVAAVLVGLAISVVASFANHYIVPEVHFRKYRVIADVVRTAFINLGLDGDRIKVLDTGYVLTYGRRDGDDFLDCTLYCPKPLEKDGSPILFIDRVSMPKPRESMGDDAVLTIQLSGTHDPIQWRDYGNHRFDVPLRDVGSQGARIDRNDDLRSDQLLAEVMRGVHDQPDEAMYTLFRRCSTALMPALLGPVGFCIAEFARDRGRVFALLLALVPLVMFYLGEVLGARLLISTRSPWCGFMPVALLTLVGTPLVWRQMRR